VSGLCLGICELGFKKVYKDILKQNGNDSDFSRFITIYGIIQVKVMNDVELIEKWTEFKNQNWSCLTLFSN
jgi:hypothetical protein